MKLRGRRNAHPSKQATAASARTVLEGEIAKHADAIIELKGRMNAMTSISTLPPEVLSEIFIALAHSYYSLSVYPGFHSHSAYKWITVTHVCRAWRNIALNTPRLWSRVILSKFDVTKEILARSKKAPLWVTAYAVNLDYPRKKLLDSIMKQSSRLKELDLTVPGRTFRNLSTVPMGPAAILEILTLSGSSPYDPHGTFLPHNTPLPVLFKGQTPNLRRLHLNSIAIKWDNPIFCPTLTHLTVAAQSDGSLITGTFAHLLAALKAMYTLEKLELQEAIPHLSEDLSTLPTLQRTVELPRLRELVISSDMLDCANFLHHVSLPANARLSVTGRWGDSVESLVRVFSTHLARCAPLLTVCLTPHEDGPTYVLGWRTFHGTAQASTAPQPDVALYLWTHENLRALQHLVRSAAIFGAVRSLEIPPSATTVDWADLFARVPQLRVLSIAGQPQPGLFDALSKVQRKGGRRARQGPGKMLAEELHTVQLTGMQFASCHSGGDLEEMLEWLILRCNEGVPVQRMELERCIHLTAEDVDRLAEVVPEVEWDEMEGFPGDVDEDGDMDFLGDEDDMALLWDAFCDRFDESEDNELDNYMLPFGF